MERNLLYQDKPFTAFVAPEITIIDDRWWIEQEFIDSMLGNPPHEVVEDVGSVVHETNRIPDPRILLVKDNEILRLDGKPVDDSIEKESYLGRLEYSAFERIKTWAATENKGVEIWFSPQFSSIYPVAKIDFGEIRHSSDFKFKVLLKKAVLLDIDSSEFLAIVNEFATRIGFTKFVSLEDLRSVPLFCSRDEVNLLLEMISRITNQVEMIKSGADLSIKSETYEVLREKHRLFATTSSYYALRRVAEEEKLIGEKAESCPSGSSTAFQTFSGGLGEKYVQRCGNCGAPIFARISKGYTCPNCGGVYEGC